MLYLKLFNINLFNKVLEGNIRLLLPINNNVTIYIFYLLIACFLR